MKRPNRKPELTVEQKVQIEMEKERQARALESYLNTGHGMPTTRRDFLASGVLGMVGSIAAPSILQLVLNAHPAHAQDAACPSTGGTGMMPFVHVNLSGGAALMANFVPHDGGGNPLASYSKMGLGIPANFTIAREFGNAPFAMGANNVLISKFLEGMQAGAVNPDQANAATAFAKTAFVGVCVRSQDDSTNNPFSAIGLVTASGLQGTDLPIMGTRNSNTGAGQMPAIKTPPAPLIVRNFNDVSGALAPSGILTQQLTQASQRESLFNLVKSLSSSQKRMLASSSSSETLGKLVECATGKNIELLKAGTGGVDPRTNAQIATTWQQQANTNNAQTVQASLVFNALNGKAGGVAIDLGGYDYHGNARANTDAQDRNAGLLIGRILRTAEILNKPVFIHVTSDGAVGSNDTQTPDAQFSSDRGSAGMSYVIVFNPAGRPATNNFQMGSFNAGQAADDLFISAWSPERATVAVFANYLRLNNKLGSLDALANRPFDANELNKVLKFA